MDACERFVLEQTLISGLVTIGGPGLVRLCIQLLSRDKNART
jgi:hypothetical protein